MASKKYLPSANEFTPNIICLEECLRIVASENSRECVVRKIRDIYFSDHAQNRTDPDERLEQQKKLAKNVLIGISNYQLIESDSKGSINLSKVGSDLLKDGENIKRNFAQHLINELCGSEVLVAMDATERRGFTRRNKKELARSLSALEIKTKQNKEISPSTTDHTKFATWMRWCGLLDENDRVDEPVYQDFVGRPSELASKLWMLSDEQYLFLRFVWEGYNLTGNEEFLVQDLLRDSQQKYGAFIQRPDQIAAQILNPLEHAGFINITKASSGRGGKSGHLNVTEALKTITAKDFEKKEEGFEYVPVVDRPLEEIFEDVESDDTHKKGVALEQLAIVIGSSLGLQFCGFRQRSVKTGGVEVDVIFEQVGVCFSRWLVQCKNTPFSQVQISTVAKEVGAAVVTNANVLLIVTTGSFSKPANQFAQTVIEKSNLQVLLLDGDDLRRFKENGDAYLIRRLLAMNEKIADLRRGEISNLTDS